MAWPASRSSPCESCARAAALDLEGASVDEAFTRLDPVLQGFAASALAATRAAELDPVLARLEELKEEFQNNYDTPLRRVSDRIENALQFYRQWQDFLAAYEHGDERDARQQLRSVVNNGLRYRPIPRAQLLARGDQLADQLASETALLLAGLDWKTLAAVRDRVSEAQEQAYGRRSTELAVTVSELDRLGAARAALDSGQAGLGRAALRSAPTTSGSSCGGASTALPLPPAVLALRESWWFEAAPALTGLAPLPPREGAETFHAYAARLLDAALADRDWPRAHRFALLAQEALPSEARPCGEREKTAGANAAAALGAYLLGRKLEDAAQPAAAASAYRDALAAGAPPALEEALIARLRALAAAAGSGA